MRSTPGFHRFADLSELRAYVVSQVREVFNESWALSEEALDSDFECAAARWTLTPPQGWWPADGRGRNEHYDEWSIREYTIDALPLRSGQTVFSVLYDNSDVGCGARLRTAIICDTQPLSWTLREMVSTKCLPNVYGLT